MARPTFHLGSSSAYLLRVGRRTLSMCQEWRAAARRRSLGTLLYWPRYSGERPDGAGPDRRSSMRLSVRHAAAHRRERRANASQFQPGKWGARGSGIVDGQPFVRPRTVTVQAGGSSGAAPPVGGFEVGSVGIGWRFVKDASGAKVVRKRHATLAPGRVSRLSRWLRSKSRWEEAALARASCSRTSAMAGGRRSLLRCRANLE